VSSGREVSFARTLGSVEALRACSRPCARRFAFTQVGFTRARGHDKGAGFQVPDAVRRGGEAAAARSLVYRMASRALPPTHAV